MSIPKRIIQTHQNAEIHAEYRKTWIDRNPEFEYLFFDDNGCAHFIQQHYPDYLPTHEKLPRKAQQADFFRYLAIHHHGGVYADVDTICREPLSGYLDFEAASLIVGIEMSADIYRHSTKKYLQEYIAPRQFAQWTFAASAGHPMLAALVLTIHRAVMQLSERQLAELSTSSRFVLELTGPIAFTQAMRFYMAFQPGQPVQVRIVFDQQQLHRTTLSGPICGFPPTHRTAERQAGRRAWRFQAPASAPGECHASR